jgi:putative oxidoreductase
MNGELREILWPMGRLLLGGLFVVGNARHFFISSGVAQAIAGRGMPFPRLVLFVGSAFAVVAGAMLIVGYAIAYAALGLALFTLAASILLLNFWSMQGAERIAAVMNWQSNIAIIGGLMIAAAYAP